MLTQAQQIERMTGIGGSDAGPIIGADPTYTATDVFLDKMGVPRLGSTDDEGIHLGNSLEPWCREEFTRRTGLEVTVPSSLLRHSETPWLIGNPDGLIVGEDAGLEIKTIGLAVPLSWSQIRAWNEGDIHPQKIAQCDHYMALTGLPKWYLACLIGGLGFKIYVVHRSPRAESELLDAEGELWNEHVLKGIPPAINDSVRLSRWLASRRSGALEDWLNVDDSIGGKARRRERLRAAGARIQKKQDELDNWFRFVIDKAKGVRGQWGKVSWTRTTRGTRVLRYNIRS